MSLKWWRSKKRLKWLNTLKNLDDSKTMHAWYASKKTDEE